MVRRPWDFGCPSFEGQPDIQGVVVTYAMPDPENVSVPSSGVTYAASPRANDIESVAPVTVMPPETTRISAGPSTVNVVLSGPLRV